MKEIKTNTITINCGEALLIYLKTKKVKIDNVNGIPGPDNCIYLSGSTTINWKSRDGKVRINCKEQVKEIIESKTQLTMFKNGVGDPAREYSLLVDNQADLDSVIEAIKH